MNTEEDEFKRIEAEAKRQTPCKGTSMKEKTKEMADAVGAVYPTLFLGRHDGVLFTETELETFVELVAADAILAIKQALAQPEQEPTPWRDMVVVSLVREGVNKHRARELADHFAAERNNG